MSSLVVVSTHSGSCRLVDTTRQLTPTALVALYHCTQCVGTATTQSTYHLGVCTVGLGEPLAHTLAIREHSLKCCISSALRGRTSAGRCNRHHLPTHNWSSSCVFPPSLQ